MGTIFRLINKRKILTVIYLALNIISITFILIWNKQLSKIIDKVNTGNYIDEKTITITIIIIIINAILVYVTGIIMAWFSETLSHELRMGIARNLLGRSLEDIYNINSGEGLSKLQNEANDISAYLNNNLSNITSDVIRFTATFSFLIYTNHKLTLMVNLPVLIIIIYIIFSSKIISKAISRSQESKKRLNRFADVLFSLFPIIKVFDASMFINDEYKKELMDWEKHTITAEKRRALLMSLSGLLSLIPLVLLLLIGGNMVIDGVLSTGTLYLFINLSGNVSGIMMNMPSHISSFRRFIANIKRLQNDIDI